MCTRYCSIFLISGYQSIVPSSPIAFHIPISSPEQRDSSRWNIASCWSTLKCSPMREFLYCMQYWAWRDVVFNPSNDELWRWTAKISSFFLSHLWLVSCQIYLSWPKRKVWRISQGLSLCGFRSVPALALLSQLKRKNTTTYLEPLVIYWSDLQDEEHCVCLFK